MKLFYEKTLESEDNCEVDFSFEKIYEFAKNVITLEVKDILDLEIAYNTEIAKDGIENDWGSNIGKIILKIILIITMKN